MWGEPRPAVSFVFFWICISLWLVSQLTRDERSDHEEEEESSTTEDEAEKKHKLGNGQAAHMKTDKNGCFGCLSPPEDICRSKTVCWVIIRTWWKSQMSETERRQTLSFQCGRKMSEMCESSLRILEDEAKTSPAVLLHMPRESLCFALHSVLQVNRETRTPLCLSSLSLCIICAGTEKPPHPVNLTESLIKACQHFTSAFW